MSNSLSGQDSLGAPLWATHALWTRAIAAWAKKNGNGNKKSTEWSGIEFDKLAHFIHLCWNALHATRPGLVSFKTPYVSEDGVHGPGPALPARRTRQVQAHIPALKAIVRIQDAFGRHNPDLHLFGIRKRMFAGKEQFLVRPGLPGTFLPTHLSSIIMRPAFTERDLDMAAHLDDLVSSLERAELRALGTHQSEEQTLIALEYNIFIHIVVRYFREIDRISGTTRTVRGGAPERDLPSLDYVVAEIFRKARTNRVPYASGYNKLLKAAGTNPVAASALSTVFSSPDQVWTDKVTGWQPRGARIQDMYYFLAGLEAHFLSPSTVTEPRRLAAQRTSVERKEKRARAAAARIRAESRAELPDFGLAPRLSDYPWAELKRVIVAFFDTLPGTSVHRHTYLESRIRSRALGGDT